MPTPEELQGRLSDDGAQYITPGLRHDATPTQVRLPGLAELGKLTNAELLKVLNHYGVTKPWPAMVSDAQAYVARMSELTGPAFDAEVLRLTGTRDQAGAISRRGLLGMNRRISQQWSALDAIDGNVNQGMIWLTEMDDDVCDNCEGNAGDENTFAEWQIKGPPGASVCLGGDA